MDMPSALRAAAAAITCVLLSATTLADTVTQDVNLTATVPASCTLGGSSAPTALSQVVPVVNGQVVGTTIGIEVPLVCNTRVQVDIASINAGMRGPTAAQGTANVIDYSASVSGQGLPTVNLNTPSATPGQFFGGLQSSQVPNGQINILITPAPPSIPLRAGVYSDTLRVRLSINQ